MFLFLVYVKVFRSLEFFLFKFSDIIFVKKIVFVRMNWLIILEFKFWSELNKVMFEIVVVVDKLRIIFVEMYVIRRM